MTDGDGIRDTAAALAVLAANLYPVVGVLAFDWNATPILVLYWVEMGVTAVWAVPRALLAQPRDTTGSGFRLPFRRLRKKRGGFAVGPATAYVRNVPIALQQVGAIALFWLAFGVGFGYALSVPSELTPSVGASVAVGGVGMFVAHGIEFARDYVGEREYATTTDREAIVVTARQGLFLAVLLFAFAGTDARATGVPVVVAVVLAKLAVDAYGRRVAGGNGVLARLTDRLRPDETSAPAPEFELPNGDPDAVVRPHRRAVLLGAVVSGFAALANRPAFLCILLTAFLAAFVSPLLALVPAALLVVGFLAGVAVHYLLRGTVEYRRYGRTLVGYDRLLDAPQWRAPLDEVDATVGRSLANRHLGTATVSLDWRGPDDSRFALTPYEAERTRATVGPVPDLGRAARDLDLPVDPDGRSDPNRTVALATTALLCVLVLAPVGIWRATGDGRALVLVPALGVVLVPLCWVALYNV